VKVALREWDLDRRVLEGRKDRRSDVAADLDPVVELRRPEPKLEVQAAFAKPREQVEASVTHLAVMKTIFLGYLRQLRQIDQTYARRMLDEKTPDAVEVRVFTGLVESVMSSVLTQLNNHQAIRRVGPAVTLETVRNGETSSSEPVRESAKAAGSSK